MPTDQKHGKKKKPYAKDVNVIKKKPRGTIGALEVFKKVYERQYTWGGGEKKRQNI